MSKRTAYFSTGEIIEVDGGRAQFKRAVKNVRMSNNEKIMVWFRPCDQWKKAVKNYNDVWAQNRGFTSYDGYLFIQSIVSDLNLKGKINYET